MKMVKILDEKTQNIKLESDLFDIETAIKVCKDLTHFD